jgi:hypothetical protein
MAQALTQSISDLVRKHVHDAYLKPALQKGAPRVTVNVGEVHKALALINRVPLVCAALKSRKFLEENKLRLVSKTGPPSGQSTTVTFTYEILSANRRASFSENPLMGLRGIAKDVFEKLGGGEAFVRSERTRFNSTRE